MKIYVLLHDKEDKGLRTYYAYNKPLFKKMNAEGWGVYFAVNDFEATTEEMVKLGVKTKRNIPFLTSLNHVFADLDVAKRGDGQTRETKEEKKEALLFALYDVLPPSTVIHTSNGLQPLWKLKDCATDPTTQRTYSRIIKGIAQWAKQFGSAGDDVKDVTRILRLPGYYHMKEEPFMVEAKEKESFVYTLEEVEKAFEKWLPPLESERVFKPVDKSKLDSLSLAIDRLDFQEVIIKAFSSVGRSASFDRQKRLILDGRLTGTHQGKTGDGEFLASSSHEPFTGNRITATADIKQITNKEARAWIIEEFGLREKAKAIERVEAEATVKEIEKPKEIKPKKKSYYSWGTKELSESFAVIKSDSFSIVGAGYGVGKTTFCMHMAFENLKLGHKVLYLSLEMSNEQLYDYFARKYAGWTIPEEIYDKIPEEKQRAYDRRYRELENLEGFTLKGLRGGKDISWAVLVEFMKGDYDLIFVDNFNLIEKEQGMKQYEHEGWLSKKFLGYSADNQVPLVVIHHYSQGGAKETVKTGYSLSGSAMIKNDAMNIVLLDRTPPKTEPDAPPQTDKEKAEMKVLMDKGRAYVNWVHKVVYFYKGGFVDNYPKPAPEFDPWQNKI